MALFFTLCMSSTAQDIIIKKNGKKIWAKIIEINDKQIKYNEYTDQGGLVFTMDRAVIREIRFESGADYEEELPGTDESYYVDDRQYNLKVNFFGFSVNTLQLALEKSLTPASSLEASIKIFGLGLDDNSDWGGGFGLGLGYKVTTGSLFKGGDYRPKHLLHGGYIRPRIGANFRSYSDYYWNGSSSIERNTTISMIHGGIDLGKQWIFNNQLSLDLFAGFHYYGSFGWDEDGNGDRLYDRGIEAGDIFGGENRAFSFGLNVGILFGAESSSNKKKSRK